MTPGPPAGVSLPSRRKLALLVVGPVLVWLVFALFAAAGLGTAGPVDLPERSAGLSSWFERLLGDATQLAAAALAPTPAPLPSRSRAGWLDARLEGVAILDDDANVIDWSGVPAQPPERFTAPESSAWRIRPDGVSTRLLARAGPDEAGRFALASFVLDSSVGERSFEILIPRRLRRGVGMAIEFRDPLREGSRLPAASPPRGNSPATVELASLRSPAGDLLAVATITPNPIGHRKSRLRATGLAYASLLLLVLVAVLFDWRTAVKRLPGLATTLIVIVAARWLLIQAAVCSFLLPRRLGTASLYGSTQAWGLLASPADLLLTGGALYLGAIAIRRRLALIERARLPLCLVASTAAVAGVSGMLLSVAQNSRASLLDRPGILQWGGSTLLTVGLVLAMLSAAELLGLGWTLLRRSPIGNERPARLPVVIAFLLLAVGASYAMQRMDDRRARERLRTTLAPQILEQSSRRRIALIEAVHQFHEGILGERIEEPDAGSAEYLAYRFWVAGELFHNGFKSSLDFYNWRGESVSHFGFDLPALDEQVGLPDDGIAELIEESELFALSSAASRRLLHAEIPVFRDGELLGVVVGHVLDEPSNLPFLPGSQPYLAALGPGAANDPGGELLGVPHYVLYDSRGRVGLNTLQRPPPWTADLALAVTSDEFVHLEVGDDSYAGLPLADGEFVHLILVPVRDMLDRLAGAARLAGAGLLGLALLTLAPRLLRFGGARELVAALRGSFYRKLVAAVLIASVLPLIGLALFLRGYIEGRADAALDDSAIRLVGAARRALEDYAESAAPDDIAFNDNVLHWLRRVVGQEIHVYEDGLLQASSKRELFASGLLTPRLDGDVHRRLVDEGLPFLVVPTRIGPREIPVAYAEVFEKDPLLDFVAAVPLVVEERQIARAVDRVAEMILLATLLLAALLTVVATSVARNVARPVRELVEAAGRISAGDYGTRLQPRTRDEVAELMRGFNSMAASLETQRADLLRQRDHTEALLHHATTGVVSIDPAGHVVTLNPAARALLAPAAGAAREGADLVQILTGCKELLPVATYLDAVRDGDGEPKEIDLDDDVSPRRLRVARVELPDPAGTGTVGSLILLDDVTDLMRSNQLSAWAEMARAIAHEIKNPLTPIQLSTEHLKRLLADRGVLPAPDLDACLDTVIKQVRTLHEIAGAFSAYAKLPELTPHPADPVTFMQAAIEPYRVAPPDGLTIEESYEPSGFVSIDTKVLTRAVVNLVANALDAMPDGGILRCSVAPHTGDGDLVALSIEDTGTGLDSRVRRRLFEPYFSTKSAGTGLGLAIVRRVVEAHDGRIEVQSTPGQGTRFRILLPVVTERSPD